MRIPDLGRIKINECVYPPSEDTWMIADIISKERIDQKFTVVDVGTGSGVLGVLACKKGSKEVLVIDIAPCAVEVAKLNLNENCNETLIHVIQGDMLSSLREGTNAELVLFNPPYLPPEEINWSRDDPCTIQFRMSVESMDFRNDVSRFLQQLLKLNFRKAYLVSSTLTLTPGELTNILPEGLEAKVIASRKFFYEEIYIVELRAKGSNIED